MPQKIPMENKAMPRTNTSMVLVHFTGAGEVDFARIKKRHQEAGLMEIGYHFVIERDGKLLMGRHQSKVGNHYPEFDAVSVGVCVVGERDDLNESQSIALALLLDKLQRDYPGLESVKYIYRTE